MINPYLELDILQVQIRKIKPGQDVSSNRLKIEKGIVPFSELLCSLKKKAPDKKPHAQFLQEIISLIDTNFYHNKENTKAISFSHNPTNGFSPEKGTLWGIYQGGLTGENYDVFDRSDVEKSELTINEDKVTTTEYYFSLWLPEQGTTGILVFQKYKHQNCVSLMRKVITMAFCKNGYKPQFVKNIPQQYVSDFLDNCSINAIDIVRTKFNYENEIKPVIQEFCAAKIVRKITQLAFKLDRFLSLEDFKKNILQSVGAVIPDYDESEDDIIVHYKNEFGASVKTRLANVEDMLPNYVLDVDYFDGSTKRPIWHKLHEEVQHIVEKMQRQMS